tara:strand:+ start:727 stop:2835 length:2109 start_codon:yes stop_codon:yes gene_type:complete
MDDGAEEDSKLSEKGDEEINESYSEPEFMSVTKWYYLSYLLLGPTWVSIQIMNEASLVEDDVGVSFTILPLITVFSFSKFIHLRYNDKKYTGITFFNNSSYLKVIIQLCLYFILLPYLLLGPIEFIYFIIEDTGGWDSFVRSLYPILIFLVIISLSFEKKDLKETESDSENELVEDSSNKGESATRFIQIILGLLAFFTFAVGFLFAQWASGNFGPRYGTFADALPCYSIAFVSLILMLAAGLGAQGVSEPSQKEKIKAANWKKFKTRMIVLVVVFSLLMPLLWYESEIYWEDRKNQIIDYGEDCNDVTVGPDVDLVGVDFSNMKLRGCDLSNRDLTGATFLETNLACVDFSNSILKNAYFYSPDIKGAVFDDVDLSNADFQGTVSNRAVSHSSYYYDVKMVSCDYDLSFKGANLTNANFEITLSGDSRGFSKLAFDNATLDNANFVVNPIGYGQISFDNAILDNSNFVFSPYSQVSMVNVSFIETDLSVDLPPGSNLSQSNMSEANFIDFLGLHLSSCPLSLPEAYGCVEIGGKKMIFGSGMDFSNKDISFYDPDSLSTDGPSVDFSGLYLPNSTFHGVHLSGSNMSNSNLSNSNFTYEHKRYNEEYLSYDACMNDGTNCSKYAEELLDEWAIDQFSDLKPFWSTNLTNVDFTGSNLSYSDFSYSNMLGANLDNTTLTGVKWYYTVCPDGSNSGKAGSCVS